ncbi:MAG: hypothetical protein KGI54_12780 [Pseudomonadota bacterium]|nr:hypothetical protein [Pseudomonadota bacterium]
MKLSKITLAVTCMAFSATALASTADIQASNNQAAVKVTSTHVDYTETGSGIFGTPTGTLDTESGNVSGYELSVSTMKNWWLGNDYLELQYSHNSGNTNYVGQLISGGAGYGSIVSSSGATLTDYSIRYGKGFVVSDGFMLTPYAELGHHKWDRGVNEGETYTDNYYGLGALAQFSPADGMVLTANALAGSTFGSNISVSGPDAFSGSLGNSTLYKVGIGADYAFTRHFHADVGLDYTSFKYGMSALYPVPGGVAWEPDSTTHYTTLKLGVGYAF